MSKETGGDDGGGSDDKSKAPRFLSPMCAVCHEKESALRCQMCNGAGYCSQACRNQALESGEHEEECAQRRQGLLVSHLGTYVAMNRVLIRQLYHLFLLGQRDDGNQGWLAETRKGAVVVTVDVTAGAGAVAAGAARKRSKSNQSAWKDKFSKADKRTRYYKERVQDEEALARFSEMARNIPANVGGQSARELIQSAYRRFVPIEELATVQGVVSEADRARDVVDITGVEHSIHNLDKSQSEKRRAFLVMLNVRGFSAYACFPVTAAVTTSAAESFSAAEENSDNSTNE